jgi:CrcB protein
MHKLILVFLGGGLGSAVRYGSTLLATRLYGTNFPWGTLAVNLAGCLLIGLLFGFSEREGMLTPGTRLFLMTGFMGGLTTFSTYALETSNFARTGSWSVATSNLLANNVAGLLLVVAGMWLAQKLVPGG